MQNKTCGAPSCIFRYLNSDVVCANNLVVLRRYAQPHETGQVTKIPLVTENGYAISYLEVIEVKREVEAGSRRGVWWRNRIEASEKCRQRFSNVFARRFQPIPVRSYSITWSARDSFRRLHTASAFTQHVRRLIRLNDNASSPSCGMKETTTCTLREYREFFFIFSYTSMALGRLVFYASSYST